MGVFIPDVNNMNAGLNWAESENSAGPDSGDTSAVTSTQSEAGFTLATTVNPKDRSASPAQLEAKESLASSQLPTNTLASESNTVPIQSGLTYTESHPSSSTIDAWKTTKDAENPTITSSYLPSAKSTTFSSRLTSTTSPSSTKTSISTSTSVVTPIQTATSDPSTFSGGPSNKTKIAIAVPVSIIGLALLLAIIFFLIHRRRRNNRNSLPPPYHIATGQATAVSTQRLMVSPKLPASPRSNTAMSMPVPLISISPSTDTRGRSPSPASQSSSLRNAHSPVSGPGSQAELGIAIAVPVDHRRSATESELYERGSRQLARMPFEDFEDDEVGVGPAGRSDEYDDDAVSDVSDSERRGRRRQFDEVSDVSSFNDVSPISPSSPEERRFR